MSPGLCLYDEARDASKSHKLFDVDTHIVATDDDASVANRFPIADVLTDCAPISHTIALTDCTSIAHAIANACTTD